MKNTFIVILSVIVAIFIVICGTIIVLMQFPDLGGKILNQTTETQKIIETTTVAETTKAQVEETIKEEPVSYTIKSYIDDTKNININYPEVKGMKDTEQQVNVNNKLYINALSIVTLYPINPKKQKLSVTPEVVEITDTKITVVYTGQLENPSATQSSKTTNSNRTARSSSNSPYNGSSKYSDNPSNNYQIPGSRFNPSVTGAQNFNSANVYNNGLYPLMPTEAVISQIAPALDGRFVGNVVGQASTKSAETKRIFYTNTIDLTHCIDLNHDEKVSAKALANYTISKEIEFVNLTQDEEAVKKYINGYHIDKWQTIFSDSDFRNKLLKKWPTSFSYEIDGNIYFSIPVSSKLGDYVIAKYKYSK